MFDTARGLMPQSQIGRFNEPEAHYVDAFSSFRSAGCTGQGIQLNYQFPIDSPLLGEPETQRQKLVVQDDRVLPKAIGECGEIEQPEYTQRRKCPSETRTPMMHEQVDNRYFHKRGSDQNPSDNLVNAGFMIGENQQAYLKL